MMDEVEVELASRTRYYGMGTFLTRFEVEQKPEDRDSIHDVVMKVVASTLGEVLRKAFRDHVTTCEVCSVSKYVYSCDEGKRLYSLQCDGDTIAFA